jgi:glycerol-3-phosphate responsive antiterminator
MLKQALDADKFNRQLNEEKSKLETSTSLSGRVDLLEKKIDLILEKMESVKKGTDKMTTHIDFINDIYSKVKTPLFWICDRVTYMTGYSVSYIPKQYVRDKQTGATSIVDDQD